MADTISAIYNFYIDYIIVNGLIVGFVFCR